MRTILSAIAIAILPMTAAATTLPIIGNVTTVEVTADITALNLAAAPFGTATADLTGANPVFSFPITGGSVDTVSGNALIEHDGSGVTVSAVSDPTIEATIGNFLIDTNAGTVSGDIIGGPTDVLFFTLGNALPGGIELLISVELAGALASVSGTQGLAGAVFGLAIPDVATGPAPIPLPGTAWLLLGGLGLGVALRRRKPV